MAKVTASAVDAIEARIDKDRLADAMMMQSSMLRRRAIIAEVLDAAAEAVANNNLTFFLEDLDDHTRRPAVR